ncbi:uncharacterized protein PV09_01864 [Verruconis gallopava]|uniref:F-box domain-containing protein n=1 Tax=Verruconis gallopava TaxID=253628 RepID=A0A0D2B9R2_9PEZI|nr:uncharacterized protein PV09_01864 [Verruconis gallopava]KIW07964.1 hypothetical protein PV09_01864 [Verruconis gallopava]
MDSPSCNAASIDACFPLLELPRELQLKCYELVVTFPYPQYLRELTPISRVDPIAYSAVGFWTNSPGWTPGQPAITKVSRQVRKDSLELYYKCNTFIMDYNVTEISCLWPTSRFPNASSAENLRYLRSINCHMRLDDKCPNPGSPKLKCQLSLNVNVRISGENNIEVELCGPESVNTRARKEYLVREVKASIGEPGSKGYDGIHLLKAAVILHEGLVCTDSTPQWRDIGLRVSEHRLFFALVSQPEVPSQAAFNPGGGGAPSGGISAPNPRRFDQLLQRLQGGGPPYPPPFSFNNNLPSTQQATTAQPSTLHQSASASHAQANQSAPAPVDNPNDGPNATNNNQ